MSTIATNHCEERVTTSDRAASARAPILRVAGALLAAFTTSSVLAMGHTTVIWPSGDETGVTDTQVLQDALLQAGPEEIVELQEGTFFINKPLLASGFTGQLRGVGMEQTIVTTVGELPTSSDCPAWANPPSVDNPWPAVITFDRGG